MRKACHRVVPGGRGGIKNKTKTKQKQKTIKEKKKEKRKKKREKKKEKEERKEEEKKRSTSWSLSTRTVRAPLESDFPPESTLSLISSQPSGPMISIL